MTNDWIEHDGGPQPVDDDVWVEIDEGHIDHDCGPAREFDWNREEWFRWNVINQHLIDAARLEGIRLGLEAAMKIVWKDTRWMGADGPGIGEKLCLTLRDLNPDTIAREVQDMGSGKEAKDD